MRFRAAVEGATTELTESEQKIGTILLSNPREAPLMTAAQLAGRVGVHESTVIRFAQKLGYSGYVAMRNDLALDSLEQDKFSARIKERGDEFTLDFIVQAQMESLSRLPDHIPQDSVDAAATAISTAETVHVYGQGFLAPLAQFIERKLLLLGVRVTLIREGGQELVERIAAIQPRDTLILFAFSEHLAGLSHYVEAVQAQGATVVLITDESATMMRPVPTVMLALPRPEIRFGLFVPLTTVCYALEFAITHQSPEKVRATRERVAGLGRPPTNGSTPTAT